MEGVLNLETQAQVTKGSSNEGLNKGSLFSILFHQCQARCE
jgi:hypothetical protein